MSIEENAEIANQFAQVWGQFSLTAIDELASPDLVVIYPVFEQSPLALIAVHPTTRISPPTGSRSLEIAARAARWSRRS